MKEQKLNVINYLELIGEKVYLKPLGKEHLEEYWQNLENSSIESIIFTGTQQVLKRDGLVRYLDNISSDSSRVDLLIFSKETNQIVGEVVLNDIYRNNRSANIRVCISRKEDFGCGYGTEAIILALNYGFGMLNLHRIELTVFTFNERAIHVYEKIGFQREGVQRDVWYFNHKYYDFVMMSILEDEFRERYQIEGVDLKSFL